MNTPAVDFDQFDGFYNANSDVTFNTSGFSGGVSSVTVGSTQSITLANVYLGGDLNYIIPAGTPEPTSWALMLGGLGMLAFVARLRRA